MRYIVSGAFGSRWVDTEVSADTFTSPSRIGARSFALLMGRMSPQKSLPEKGGFFLNLIAWNALRVFDAAGHV